MYRLMFNDTRLPLPSMIRHADDLDDLLPAAMMVDAMTDEIHVYRSRTARQPAASYQYE